MRLIVRPEAEADLALGFDWYQNQRAGLGAEFIAEVSRTLESVADQPLQYPVILTPLRRALVRRFPYAVFFVGDPEVVVVVAALHMARNPNVLLRRWSADL